MLRTALLILSGNTASSMILLVRNLLIARLISVEDYGIAATFAVVLAVMEMASNFGMRQQIIQSSEGDDPHFQAVLQGFQLARGLVMGGVILVMAGPIADFMNVPEVAWAYRLMALAPVFTALQHFDIHRLNRQMVFMPQILSNVVPALVTTLAVWPLVLWLGDFRVMLAVSLLQTGLGTLMSHLMAQRRWRMALDRAVIARTVQFGWPLLLNNVLLFAVFNGERIIIGRELGMVDLAIFSMGITLTLTPTLLIAKTSQTFFLPQLVRIRDRGGDPSALSYLVIQALMVAGLAFAVATALVGPPVVLVLLGEKYAPLMPFLSWMAVMQVLRMVKAGPSTVALMHGFTGNAMASNIVRVLSLGPAWAVAAQGGDLRWIVWIAIVAELLGFGIALGLMRWRTGLALRPIVPSLVATLVCLAWIGLADLSGLNAVSRLTGEMSAGITLVLFGLATFTMRGVILRIWRMARPGRK